ncbi:MAG TPA: hypothetical protein VIK91_12700 [Nannocystis sp.]
MRAFARRHPGALKAAVELDLEGLAGGQVGVDEDGVALLDAVEALGPAPAAAGDGDAEVREGRAMQAVDELGDRDVAVEDDAGARAGVGGGELGHGGEVAIAAEKDGVDAGDAGLSQGVDGVEEGAAGVTGGGDAVAEEDEPLAGLCAGADRPESVGEVGGAEGLPAEDRLGVRAAESAGGAVEDLDGFLIEAPHAHREGGAVDLGEALDQGGELGDLGGEAGGLGGAGVEEDSDGARRVDGESVGAGEGDPGDREVAAAEADVGGAAGLAEDDVVGAGDRGGVGAVQFAHFARARGVGAEDLHVEDVELRQAGEREAVIGVRAGELLRIGEDELLVGAGGNGKDAGAKTLTGVVLEQGGILAAVEEILEDAAGFLALDDLALLPRFADLHGEARDRGARGELDLEGALDGAILRIDEGEVELGESERGVDPCAGLELDELQAGAVAGGERDRGGEVLGGGERGGPGGGGVRGRGRVRDFARQAAGDERERAGEQGGRGSRRARDPAEEHGGRWSTDRRKIDRGDRSREVVAFAEHARPLGGVPQGLHFAARAQHVADDLGRGGQRQGLRDVVPRGGVIAGGGGDEGELEVELPGLVGRRRGIAAQRALERRARAGVVAEESAGAAEPEAQGDAVGGAVTVVGDVGELGADHAGDLGGRSVTQVVAPGVGEELKEAALAEAAAQQRGEGVRVALQPVEQLGGEGLRRRKNAEFVSSRMSDKRGVLLCENLGGLQAWRVFVCEQDRARAMNRRRFGIVNGREAQAVSSARTW